MSICHQHCRAVPAVVAVELAVAVLAAGPGLGRPLAGAAVAAVGPAAAAVGEPTLMDNVGIIDIDRENGKGKE